MATKTGTNRPDVLIGTTYNDTISGLEGSDNINALSGDDIVSGGKGNDFIYGGSGADVLNGEDDDDFIDGGTGNDLIDGGLGNDTLIASEGSDVVSGGAGNDTFVVHGSADDIVTINDSAGIDLLDFSLGTTAATIDLRSGASSFVDGREIIINGGSVTLPLDFVLLQDLSGSFSDDVATLQELVPDLVSKLESLQPDVRFGVASFVDKPTDPFGASGDYVYQTDLALTADASAFQAAVDGLVVRNGGDIPESQIEALMQLALRPSELGFRAGALRAVVLTTDAPPHVAGDFASAGPNNGDAVLDGGGLGEDYPSVDQVRAALLDGGIVPIFAVTADMVATYEALVTELGFGTVVTLSSDSSDIIEAIGEGLTSVTTTDIENALGTDYDDIITGNDLNNAIDGGKGADLVDGGLGNDTLIASEGSDIVSGGAGNDTFVVHGSAGDIVTINDSVGIDLLDFSLGTTAATIDLRSGASSFVDGREIIINGGSVTLPLDFVLLQDLSGSFSEDVATLQELVPDLVAELESLQPDVRFGVASFVDKPTDPFGASGDYVYQTDLALTADASAFQAAVDGLVVRNGGDGPESQIEALMQLALRPSELGFRAGALRAVVLTTDAPPHVAGDFASAGPNNGDDVLDGGGLGEDYPSVDQVRAALLDGGIVPIFAVTADMVATYEALVAELGFGTVVTLSSDSSDIIEAISEGLTSVTTTDIENALGTDFADTITGNALANRIDGGKGADSMTGGAGSDTYVVDNVGDRVFEAESAIGTDLIESSVTFSLAGQFVENLTLTGNASINATGNGLANRLTGNTAANQIDGGAGIDTLIGKAGNDTYFVDAAEDQVIEAVGEGYDIVVTRSSYKLGTDQEIEELRALSKTDVTPLALTGNGLDNKIVGNAGANVINGSKGIDTLYGEAGNDSYFVDHSRDQVFEGAGKGRDVVNTYVSYTLAAGEEIEELRVVDKAAKTTISLTGNEFANKIVGDAGNNRLDGGGGIDALYGDAGNDTYVVDNGGDEVFEAVGGGKDVVATSVNFTLTAGQEIEELRILLAAGDRAINLTGNALAQTLVGNGGANRLDGGAGADTLIGGAGNDTFLVDNAGDKVTEAVGGGTDIVATTVSYTLAAGQEIEELRIALAADDQPINLTGNAFAQTLKGNGAANTLDGGAGADTMIGGAGNDSYRVDNTGDTVTEATGGGRDVVATSVNYTLASGQEIEELRILVSAGDAAINLTGNALNQTLIGNGGANVLNGGWGNDILTGGGGADAFVFANGLGTGNLDRITDFASADTIQLSKSIFTALAPGDLSAAAFKNITTGTADADDRILYKQSTGELFYDADALGSGAMVKFAVLDNKAALGAGNFDIV
nr:hypothetical protein [Methylobacterium sp. Leaf118]